MKLAESAGHPMLLRLRRGLEAFASRDLEAIAEYFAPDVLWHHGGRSALAGEYRGIDEMFLFFAKRAALSGDSYRLHAEQAIANDHFISLLGRWTAERDGRAIDAPIAIVYRLGEGQRVVEAWTNPGDPDAEAAFFAG
jgi:ketosteroid isomerase-like protein